MDEVLKEGVAGVDFVFAGGKISNGLEKVIGLAFVSSSSRSLSSSGMGTAVAMSNDSSSSISFDQLTIEWRAGQIFSSDFGGVKAGGSWREEEGGESGRAVETARRNVGLPGEVDTAEEVVGVRRRTESKERDGGGGGLALRWEGRGSLWDDREGVEVLVAALVWEVNRTGRFRGGEPTELFDSDGDRGRLGEVVVRAAEVA